MAIQHKKKTLTARQQAAKVREWTGWSVQQYQKEYDKLRNRVRNYERINGYKSGTINAADLLARNARAQFYAPRYGEQAKATQLYQAVMSTTSQSTGKKISAKTAAKARVAALNAISERYHGLLEKSNIVQKAVADLQANNPNYTAAEYEAAIISGAKKSNVMGATASTIQKAFMRKGIIVRKPIDTL